MPVGRDVAGRQREAGRRLFDGKMRHPLQRLRRREFGADEPALLGHDLDRHEACSLLEQEPRRRLRCQRRQHEGGADIGVACKRKLPVHREDANLRVVGGIGRRQHEGRLRIIELGGDRLHLFGRQPAGIEHDGEWITAEGTIGENVDSDVAPLHPNSPTPAATPPSADHSP